ncbi:hypothetical protein FCULG_00008969, partial [Fusarium culmorum]
PTLEEELNLPIEIGDKDEEEIALTYPDFYKDKFNSKVAKNKIEELKGKVSNIANLIENLTLIATRKDLGEILKLYQPDPYGRQLERLRGFLTNLQSYQMYYPIQFSFNKARV